MGHPRRMYSAGTVYLVTNRVADGLPFVANLYITMMLFGVLARASSRFRGITICTWLFLGNHYHAVLILRGEPAEFSAFMNFVDGEIAKLVTRWLGKRNVKVWAQRYHAAPLLTSEDVFDRIVYVLMNPVQARLVSRPEHWEGVTTFYALNDARPRSFKRIMPGSAPRLANAQFSSVKIDRLVNEIRNSDSSEYELIIEPFAWMDCFRDTRDCSVEHMKMRLMERLKVESEELSIRMGPKVLGARALACANPHQHYRPKKRGRRIPCISANWELRRRFLASYRSFCQLAAKAWHDAKATNILPKLPPGAFYPPKPFRCCLYPCFAP